MFLYCICSIMLYHVHSYSFRYTSIFFRLFFSVRLIHDATNSFLLLNCLSLICEGPRVKNNKIRDDMKLKYPGMICNAVIHA